MAFYPTSYRVLDVRGAVPHPGSNPWQDWGILPFSGERFAVVTTYQSGTSQFAPDDHFMFHKFVHGGFDDVQYVGEQDLPINTNFRWHQVPFDAGRGRKYDERWPVYCNLREDWVAWAAHDRLAMGDIAIRAVHWGGVTIDWPGLPTVVYQRPSGDVHMGDPRIAKLEDGLVVLAWLEQNYDTNVVRIRAIACFHDGASWSPTSAITVATATTDEWFVFKGLTRAGEGAAVSYEVQGFSPDWYQHTRVTYFDPSTGAVGATASVPQGGSGSHDVLVECGRGRVVLGFGDFSTYQLFAIDAKAGVVGPAFGFSDPDNPGRPPGEVYGGGGVRAYWHGEADYINLLFALNHGGDDVGTWIFAEEVRLKDLVLERASRSVMVPELMGGGTPLGLGFHANVSGRLRRQAHQDPAANHQLLRRDRVAAGAYGSLYRRDGSMTASDEIRLFAFVIPVRFRRVPTEISGRFRSRLTAFA